MIEPRKPGIYNSIGFDEYRAIDAINASALKHAVKSPAHYRYARTAKREQTESQSFGEALHLAVLEPERYTTVVAVSPKFDRRTKQGKADAEAFAAANVGKTIIDEADAEAINAMRESCLACPAVRQIIGASGQCEATALWREAGVDLDAKARFDRISFGAKCIADVKTARDASPEGFARACAQYQYHFSAAWYMRGALALTSHPFRFTWIALEKEPPYAVAVYEPTERMLDVANNQIESALRRVKDCEETGVYPAYASESTPIDLPEWAVFGWDA